MSTELKQFDALTADITQLVSPTLRITVTDDASSQQAIEAVKAVKNLSKLVDEKRTELVGPLNQKVKAVNEYAKQVTEPLAKADAHLRTQINAYAAKKEEQRREEMRRIEEARARAEEAARLERERAEQELAKQLQAKEEDHAEAISLFGAEGGDVDASNAAVQAETDRIWAEKQAELARQDAERKLEYQQAVFDSRQSSIKNTKTTMKVRVVDINLVPREFLILEVNTKAAVAAGKAGAKIPGLEFYEEVSVSIGATTRIPSQRRLSG
jgi:hypothetical protein